MSRPNGSQKFMGKHVLEDVRTKRGRATDHFFQARAQKPLDTGDYEGVRFHRMSGRGP